MEVKTCKDCNIEQPIENFPRTCGAYRRKLCRKCYNKTRLEYEKRRRATRNTALYHREYYAKNKEKILKRMRENQARCNSRKEYHAAYKIGYYKNRSRLIARKIKNRINKSIINGNFSKKTKLLLGYNIQTLRDHLQSQFTAGMNWDNYGTEWALRYSAIANFDLTEPSEFRQYFDLSNVGIRKVMFSTKAAKMLLSIADK